jgi:hypothetical protein
MSFDRNTFNETVERHRATRAQRDARAREAALDKVARRRPDYRRTRLLRDGRKALAMLDQGKSIPDVRMVIGGSRARLYRAIAAARAHAGIDLLLL